MLNGWVVLVTENVIKWTTNDDDDDDNNNNEDKLFKK